MKVFFFLFQEYIKTFKESIYLIEDNLRNELLYDRLTIYSIALTISHGRMLLFAL